MAAVALRLAPFKAVIAAPVATYKQWAVIAVVALLFVLMPQLPNNDWQRNAADLPNGAAVYQDPAYVYPPWVLVLMYPFYLLTAPGSRVATVLVIGWLAQRRGWSLGQFLAIVLSPLFLWTMVLSSADVMVLVIPILLWEMGGRWRPALRGLALAILLLKPQVALLLIAYWLWTLRRQPRELLLTLATAVALTLPISMIGSPPLLAQWFANITHPVAANLDHWVYNNLSLTYRYGLIFGLSVVLVAFGGLLLWMRRRRWTSDDSVSVSLTVAMLLGPYAANQGAIVPIALNPSWRITLLAYVTVLGTAILNVYAIADDWILLSLVILSIVFAAQAARVRSVEGQQGKYAQTN